ncbi:MAG: glycosyltransferase family 39 protein [Planctomycetota bacterium]|nr:glycosyltransferase family 39 protein [Planctomycetota bacterium]
MPARDACAALTSPGAPVDQFALRPVDLRIAGVLALAALLLYLLPARSGRLLTETPELRIAIVAREMIQNGEYVVPTLGGKERLIKPPLPYWLTAIAARASGPLTLPSPARGEGEHVGGGKDLSVPVMCQAVQIPSALFGALTVFLITLYGTAVFGRTAGVLAGLIIGTSIMPGYFAQLGHCDATLAFCCAGMVCCAAWIVGAQRPGIIPAAGFGLCLGLGVLTKWYIPAVLTGLPLLIEAGIWRTFDRRKVLLFALGFLVAAAVVAPWFILLEGKLPGACRRVVHLVIYATEAVGHRPMRPLTYYFEKLALGFLPWTALVLAAWPLTLLKRGRADGQAIPQGPGTGVNPRVVLRFLVLSFGLGFLAFYSQPKQQWYYLLPLFPAGALLAGYVLSRFTEAKGRGETILACCVGALGLICGIAMAGEPFWVRFLNLTHEEAATSRRFLQSITWTMSCGAGLAVAGFLLWSARQIRRGRILHAAILISVPAYCGLLAWSWYRAEKSRTALPLYTNAAQLRAGIDGAGKETRVYGTGSSEPMLIFYLERPVLTVKSLSEEPMGQTGPNAPKRVLVATPESIRTWRLERLLPNAPPGFSVYELPGSVDWPNEIGARLSKAGAPKDTPDEE